MALLALAQNGSSSSFSTGGMYRFRHQQSAFANSFFTQSGNPFMTALDGQKASMIKYEGDVYGVGGFSKPWVFDRHYRCYKQTMIPPDTLPVVTTTAGAVNCIPYTSFWDKKSGERSSLSGAGAAFTWNNSANRTWTLPTIPPDEYTVLEHTTTVNASTTVTTTGDYEGLLQVGDRLAVSSAPTAFVGITGFSGTSILVDTAVGDGTTQTIIIKARSRASHVEMWLSVDGADIRFVGRRDLGTVTAVEAVPTLALGEVAPDIFTAFPSCAFNAVYHDRQIMAGNRQNPDTVYLSELFFPERYGGLNFKTRNGEPVTGMVAVRDVLLVMTKNSTYRLQGYTEDDFELVLDDADIGCITHFGISVIYGDAWVPDTKGVFRWNGGYQPMMKDVQSAWRKDYAENSYIYENGYAYHDGNDYTYNFVLLDNDVDTTVPDPTPLNRNTYPPWLLTFGPGIPNTLAWVAYYKDSVPQVSGTYDQPDWFFDYYETRLNTVGVLSSSGGKRSDVFYGRCDGIVGLKDPNVAVTEAVIIQTPHMEYGNPGGSSMDGKTLTELWIYNDTSYSDYTVYALGGDDNAFLQTRYIDEVADPPRLFTDFLNANLWKGVNLKPSETLVSTVHYYHPEKVIGRGFTVYFISLDSLRLEFRGLGGKYMVGPTYVGVLQADPEV